MIRAKFAGFHFPKASETVLTPLGPPQNNRQSAMEDGEGGELRGKKFREGKGRQNG